MSLAYPAASLVFQLSLNRSGSVYSLLSAGVIASEPVALIHGIVS